MNTEADFERALNAYDCRTRSHRRTKHSRRELLAYSAAATGVALMAPEAVQGAVIHHTTPQTFAVTNGVNTFSFDIDGAGDVEFGIYLSGTGGAGTGYGVGSLFGNDGVGSASAYVLADPTAYDPYVLPIPGSFNVSAGAASWSTYGLNINTQYAGGTAYNYGIPNHATGYVGVEFLGDTGSMGTQYGWIKMRPDLDPNTGQYQWTFLEWAYDDEGDPIHVPSVPEPDTAWLALLGLGAMGVQRFRRRKGRRLEEMAESAGTQA